MKVNTRTLNRDILVKLEIQAKKKAFWKDPDLQQIYWLGVIEGLQRAKNDRMTDWLHLCGCNAVRDHYKKEWSYHKVKYCPVCNKEFGYRTRTIYCCEELKTRDRYDKYIKYNFRGDDPDITLRISIEQYVGTLEGIKRQIAHKLLIQQYEVIFENGIKQVAAEMDISVVSVYKWKRKILAGLRAWL